MSASNVEALVYGETATARLGHTTIHGRVVGLPSNGSNYPLVAILPEGAKVMSYVDCWISEGWIFRPGAPNNFDGDTSPEALAAWAAYIDAPAQTGLGPEQIEQDAFTAGYDTARQQVNA